MRCAARLLGVISNCAGYSASFFSNRAGTPIGHSLTALCVDWEILPHRDAIRQDSDSLGAAVRASGKNLSDIAKRWTFEGVDQKLTAALAQSCGSTAPLKLWAYVNLWPRDLAEKLKSELLKEIYTEDGEVDRTCELLAWTHLTQSGKGLTAEERKAIDTQYPRWMAACSRVLDKMVQARQKYQSLTDPKLSVVGLLEEWATLPSLAGHGRRGRVTSLLEKERKLYTKLDAHPEGTTLSWVTRKACYLSILKAFPRVKRSGESFIMLFQSVKSSQSYEEVLDVLSRHAYKSGYKDADELLGGGDEDRAQATTNGKREHRDDDIPRPKFRPPNSRNGRERREKRPDPQAVLTSKSPGSSEQGRKRPTSFFATEQDGPAKKRSRLTAIDHAKANGVTESLAKERVEKGQCAICGSADHFARACPKNSRSATKPGGTRSHEDSRKTNRDETVLLTMGKAEVLAGTVEVSTPGPAVGGRSRLVHARAGFDTMCSQNLITKGIVDLLEATPVEGEQVRLQTAGGIREANDRGLVTWGRSTGPQG
ncbi:hypothetical protein FOL46_000626 [Perkinsus olseni]|nr:hypothetical protein FOL46_000626 [Perkinsus olseni]